jgi:hypothetical protein
MADVSTPNSEFTKAEQRWRLIEDACAGEDAVKAAGEKYLPTLNPTDKGTENRLRNEDYRKRAVYYNASGRTLRSLTGLAFVKSPEITVPAALDAVKEDADGAGQTLIQHMHATLSQVLKTGRAGLLTDFPKTEKPTSRADEVTNGIRPTVTFYDALSIINWRTTKIGAEVKLSLVVLSETHIEPDGFAEKEVPQFRVLRLDAGLYSVELWRKKKDDATGKEDWVIHDQFAPVDGASTRLDFIPFTFVGSENNGTAVNPAPMYDIASLNLAHYRNSADYEDSAHLCGQPQIVIAGLDEQWRDHLEKSGIYLGSRAILPLPTGANANMLQASPNTLCKEAMDSKEKQLASLGARLLTADSSSVKTATQQSSEDATAHSVLSLCCDNVSAAYKLTLTWVGVFANVTGDPAVGIPTEFTKFTIASDELNSIMHGVQSGLIPKSDFWSRLRQAGVIDPEKTDDEIREELESDPPPMMSLTDPAAADPDDESKRKPPVETEE